MEVASSLEAIDWNLGIFGSVDDSYGIPIGLRIVWHEAFEVWLGIPCRAITVHSYAKYDILMLKLERLYYTGRGIDLLASLRKFN